MAGRTKDTPCKSMNYAECYLFTQVDVMLPISPFAILSMFLF